MKILERLRTLAEAAAPELRADYSASGLGGAVPTRTGRTGRTEATDYTSLRTAEFLARAAGSIEDAGIYGAAATAALEACAGLYGRSMAAAALRIAPRYVVRRAQLAQMARDLILEGETLWRIAVVGGRVQLRPLTAASCNGGVDPRGWTWEAHEPGPDRFIHHRALREAQVVHVMYSSDRSYPWRGVGPLARARDTALLAGAIEQRGFEELRRAVRYLLAVDVDANAADMQQAQGRLIEELRKTAPGGLAIVESGKIDFDSEQAYRRKFAEERLGPRPDAEAVKLRAQIQASVFSACGCPPVLFSDQASTTGLREAQRAFLADGCAPLGDLIADELEAKLETPVRLDFPALARADIAAKARAWKGLTEGGATAASAAAAVGLELDFVPQNESDGGMD